MTSHLIPFRSIVNYRSNFGHLALLSHPLGGLRTTYDVHLRLISERVVDFLLVLIELDLLVLRLRRYGRKQIKN